MTAPDPATLRRLLARWTTGLAVVTTLDGDGAPLGKVVNSFQSVSLRPPLVSWWVDRDGPRHGTWIAAPGYVVHVLAHDQGDLLARFASRGTGTDPFAGVATTTGLLGMPLLSGATLRLECRTTDRLEAGDHTCLVGEVMGAAGSGAAPLLFHGGRPRTPHELGLEGLEAP